jgi:nucleoside-diphosphate-sugar epimerase
VVSAPWLGAVPPAAEWVEALSHPAIMDTAKAKLKLGWEPRYTGLEALRETFKPDSAK